MVPSSRYDPHKHHRRSIRLKGYDYSQAGMYFLTICTYNRQCLFGEVVEDFDGTATIKLNRCGEIVRDAWLRTPVLRPNVVLGEWVIMPNHIHAVVIILERKTAVSSPPSPFQSPSQTVGAIVRGFKASVTKQINDHHATTAVPVWQRNYWEHIIRNEASYGKIANYITNNPNTWQTDKLYVDH